MPLVRRLVVFVAALVLVACDHGANLPTDSGLDATFDAGPPVTISSANVRVTFETQPFAMRVQNAAGAVLLQTISEGATVANDPRHAYTAMGATHREQAIRPPIIEGWDHVVAADDVWHHATRVVRIAASDSSASIDLQDPTDTTLTIHMDVVVDGPEVRVDAEAIGPAVGGMDGGAAHIINELGQGFVLADDEHFFGLGERSVTVDHRGRHFECWTEEGGIGLGESHPPGPDDPAPNGPGMTHIPVPFLLSSRGYGLYLQTSYRTGFSMGADDPHAWRFYAVEPALHYRVLVHDDPRDTLAHYTAITGRAHLPAAWVFGPRRRTDRNTMVHGELEAQAFRDFHVPTTMVDDATHFLPSAEQSGHEAALAAWTAQVHALGFKAIAYFNPYVSISDARASSLLAYGRAHDLFVRTEDGQEFQTNVISSGSQTIATIDLTNPDAVDWYGTILQQALDLGYDGYMLDFGEYIPPLARLHDGRTGWEAHNAFPLIVQSAAFAYMQRVRGNDFQYFVRSGYAGTQSLTPMVWGGDPSSSFDDTRGIPGSVRQALNLGMSGIPFWGSDVSGYTCIHDPPADKEVYLRWAELGAFSPDMHDENACSGAPPGSPPKWTLWSDDETTRVYGQYASLHTRLIPYLYAAALEATQTGVPIMRHPILLHPDQPAALSVQFEYYFGPSLYVAPVVHRGDTSRTLWLPPGAWVDFWTMAPADGGAMVTRDAPLDVIPVYLRSGGIVAMLDPSVDTLAPHTAAGVVSMDDVRGVLDVRAAIDLATHTGHATLVDGTVFEVSLANTSVALPPSVASVDEATLATCGAPDVRCGRIDTPAPGATRVRITTEASNDATITVGGLVLHHHAPQPLRVRWDVVVR